MFEHDFDDEHDSPAADEAVDEAEAEAPDEEEAEDVPPTYSEADLKSAHDQAYAAGREAGIQEAGAALEQRAAQALGAIAEHLGKLGEEQRNAAEQAARDSAAVAVAVTRKVLPALAERGAIEEVQRLVDEALALAREEPRLRIVVHESLRDSLSDRIDAAAIKQGFAGQVDIAADPEIGVTDCRVIWSNGGAARNSAALWAEIDAIVDRNIGDRPAAADAAADDETPSTAGPDTAKTGDVETVSEDAADDRAADDDADAPTS